MKRTKTRFGINEEYFDIISKKPIKVFCGGKLVGGFDQINLEEGQKGLILSYLVELKQGYVVPEALALAFHSPPEENGLLMPRSPIVVKPLYLAALSISKLFDREAKKALYGVAWCSVLKAEVGCIEKIELAISREREKRHE